MQELRQFIRLLLQEGAVIPVELTGTKKEEDADSKETVRVDVFSIGPKSRKYLAEKGFGTNPIHRVMTENGVKMMSDIDLIFLKLNNMPIDQFYKYDSYFRKYASSNTELYKDYYNEPYVGPAVSAALLKAISIEETDLGWKTSNDISTAEGVMQVLEGTLATLNTRRKWMKKPPYATADLQSNPGMSIKIAAEIIIKHMLAPALVLPGDKNVGGKGHTIDEMLADYKSGEDGPRYTKRVKVYERFINEIIGGV
jgi:hypothetical protein